MTTSDPRGLAALDASLASARGRLKPPPRISVSKWSDENRYLSSLDSAEAGRWITNAAQYQKEILDAFSDPTVRDIVIESSAQVGKSACMLGMMGFAVHLDPGPMLCTLPTKDDCDEFSKDRFTSMCESTPVLRNLVHDVKRGASKKKSTIQHKSFPGGQLTFAWSNSPSRLSSRPIRFLFMDEIDKAKPHPIQGDPIARARARTATYRSSRKHVYASALTTLKETSRRRYG